VTVNNRLVGMIHGAFTADLPTCHRQVHTVAHPGGDDVDERGNRRRHQPKPARLRLRADRGLRAGCAATCGPWSSRLLRVPPRRAGLRTRWQRYATSRPAPTSRSSRVTSKPVSTRFRIAASWIGCGVGSGTNASWPTSNPRWSHRRSFQDVVHRGSQGVLARLSDANALASTSPAVPPVTPARW